MSISLLLPTKKSIASADDENEEKVRQAKTFRILCQEIKMSKSDSEMNSAIAQILGMNKFTNFSLQKWEKDICETVVSDPASEQIAHQVRDET